MFEGLANLFLSLYITYRSNMLRAKQVAAWTLRLKKYVTKSRKIYFQPMD